MANYCCKSLLSLWPEQKARLSLNAKAYPGTKLVQNNKTLNPLACSYLTRIQGFAAIGKKHILCIHSYWYIQLIKQQQCCNLSHWASYKPFYSKSKIPFKCLPCRLLRSRFFLLSTSTVIESWSGYALIKRFTDYDSSHWKWFDVGKCEEKALISLLIERHKGVLGKDLHLS